MSFRVRGVKRRGGGVVDLGVAMDHAAAFDRHPDRVWMAAPRAGGGRRVAQQGARRAALQVELARRAMPELARFS